VCARERERERGGEVPDATKFTWLTICMCVLVCMHVFVAVRVSQVNGRLVNKRTGQCLSSHENMPNNYKQLTKDMFHTILGKTWSGVLVMFVFTYAAQWLMWAIVWWGANKVDKHYNGTCVDKMSSFNSAIEFSIETSSSIGFGNLYVDAECRWGTLILMFQELTAKLCDCFWIGLVFQKLARPQSRMATLKFSRRAVISVLDGQQKLMFRIGDLNPGLNWASTELKLYMFHDGATAEGLHMAFRQTRLELDLHSIGLFLLPFVVSHSIDEDSPLWGMTQRRLESEKVEFILVFEGVVEVTGNTLHARTSYLSNEVKWGRFFSEVNFRDESGTARVDWRLFDETIPCSTFNDTTVFDGQRLGFRRHEGTYEGRSDEDVEEEAAFDLFSQAQHSSTPSQAAGIELSEFGSTPVRTSFVSKKDSTSFRRDTQHLPFPLPPANGLGEEGEGDDDDVPLLGNKG
jgi:hypothetical protein